MEIVKRLEGSEPEELDYEFEEHCRQEDEKQNKHKKNTILAIFGIALIAILGYFGFNFLEKDEFPKPTIETIASNQTVTNPNTTPKKNNQNNQKIEPKIIEKVKTVLKEEKKLPQETPRVSTYTEVLAQAIKPKNFEEDYVKKLEAEALNLKPKKIELTKQKTENVKTTNSVIMKQDKSHNQITFYNKEEPSKKIVTILQPVIEKSKVKKPKIVKNKRRVISVKKGDTLAIISKRYYGNSMEFKAIVSANKRLKTSKTPLKLGEKLVIPTLKKSQKKKVTHKKRRYITIKKGYSLAYISKKFYGNINEIQKIVRANKEIKNSKSTLHIGQKVYIPR